MKLVVFALDYDGTLSSDGGLGPEVQQALALAHERGLLNILVTGRRLADLAKQLAHFDAFDAIVGENGAVLHFPRTGRSTLLANPPDPEFLQELARRGVGFTAGECVVEL